jgi:hypothetical protein
LTQYRAVPTYTTPWTPGNKNDSTWYRYFQAGETGQPPSAEIIVTPTASPFIFQAPKKGNFVISGGTVTSIMLSRTAPTYYLTGQTSGVFPLAQGDSVKVTYTGTPTMTFFPT